MLAAKGFGSPDETRSFAGKGKMDVINVGGVTAGKGVFEPGLEGVGERQAARRWRFLLAKPVAVGPARAGSWAR